MEVGEHVVEQGGEAIEVFVAVVEVVDDAGVLGGDLLQDFDLIGGIAEPTAVVVEADSAVGFGGFVGDFPDGGGATADFFGLGEVLELGFVDENPEVGGGVVTFQGLEGEVDGTSEGILQVDTAAPEGGEADVVLGEGGEFLIEGRDVFGAVVVGESGEAESLEHFGAFLGAALFGVEGDDAPGHEVFAAVKASGREFLIGRRCAVRWKQQAGGEESQSNMRSHGESFDWR